MRINLGELFKLIDFLLHNISVSEIFRIVLAFIILGSVDKITLFLEGQEVPVTETLIVSSGYREIHCFGVEELVVIFPRNQYLLARTS